jgi:hypothetical protein
MELCMEKILTLHPEGKNGIKIDPKKVEKIKSEILSIIDAYGRPTIKALQEKMNDNIKDRFEGSKSWYLNKEKLDLEARNIPERIPDIYTNVNIK